MVVSEISNYKDDHEGFLELLRFRYDTYIKELNYLSPVMEFELLRMEFDKYDRYARHIVIKNDAEIIACARIIEDNGMGLPVFGKIDIKGSCMFSNQKNAEVSRLIVKKEFRSSRVFINLIRAVFKSLLNMDCTCVLADTFKNSKSYKLLSTLGFKNSGFEYFDTSFNLNAVSTLLYFDMSEMVNNLTNNPNKGQMAFLRNIGYKIV